MNTMPNLQEPDSFYNALIAAHAGLTLEQSLALNTRLVLLLANQIGDAVVLSACVAAARDPISQARGSSPVPR